MKSVQAVQVNDSTTRAFAYAYNYEVRGAIEIVSLRALLLTPEIKIL